MPIHNLIKEPAMTRSNLFFIVLYSVLFGLATGMTLCAIPVGRTTAALFGVVSMLCWAFNLTLRLRRVSDDLIEG